MEQTTMAEKVEQPTEEQTPAKPAKAADAKKPAKKARPPKHQKQPKPDDGLYLPVLAEFTFASSVIFLILVFLVIAAVSWLTGTSLLDFVLRTGIAMGVLGSLLMTVSRQVSTGVLSVSIAEIEEKRKELAAEEPDNPQPSEGVEQPEKPLNAENLEIPMIAEAQ